MGLVRKLRGWNAKDKGRGLNCIRKARREITSLERKTGRLTGIMEGVCEVDVTN